MQHLSAKINVQGQQPEKKLRVTGGFTSSNSSNYDYEVNIHNLIYLNFLCLLFLISYFQP